MDDVIYSSEDLFNTIVKYVSSDDFKRTHKSDFEKDFQTHLENIRADWAVKFLFSKNGSGSIYDKTIDTVLKILENLELVDILLGITIMPKIRDIGGMLDDDNVTWDYIISAFLKSAPYQWT